MAKTKKIKVAGRFGARYGRRVKTAIIQIETQMKKRQTCPSCKRVGVKRVAAGIWKCGKCGAKFAGGAYLPKSVEVV